MNRPLFIGIEGDHLSNYERDLLKHTLIGGVILFERNFKSYKQICELISEISKLKTPRLLVAIDQEGGRVQRFKTDFTALPAPGDILKFCEKNIKSACQVTRELAWLMASELCCIGVDFSFAPVVDIDYGISEVIGNRSFGDTKDIVSDLSRSWVFGAREAGMASVGKHFPGHGAVSEDSHYNLPVDLRLENEIFLNDLSAFKDLIDSNIEGIMPAHIIYKKCDENLASFSKYWLIDILRNQLKFEGIVFSDDLSMHAADGIGNLLERSEFALKSGCDMVLICNDTKAAKEVAQRMKYEKSIAKIKYEKMYAKNSINIKELKADSRWEKANTLAKNICKKGKNL